MRRQALAGQGFRSQQIAQTQAVPAPVGGLNSRDSIASMAATDAVVLENWFPSSSKVELRKGSANHVTGFAKRVKSLLPYSGTTVASKKLFGVTDDGIFDATSAGAVGATVKALTNGYCQSINFKTAAGSYLVVVNGTDNLQLYDGSTWTTITGVSSPAITGVATTEFIHVHAFKRRIWFVQKNSMSLWYLPVDSIAGAATEFTLGQYFTRGGFIMALGTWTIDGGEGIDDYAVIVSSEGEVAVFQGTDPNDPLAFGLVGVYYIGAPIGRRCLTKFGGDLLVICRQGLFPLSKALQTAAVDKTVALSDKIDPTFNQAATLYAANEGWEILPFPEANFLLVNVPTSSTGANQQLVMNTVTGAWTKFTGLEGFCWANWDNKLYFGSFTTVVQGWTGTEDLGADIRAVAKTGYNYFGTRIQLKHLKLVRPNLVVDKQISISYGMETDFGNQSDLTKLTIGSPAFSIWDTDSWDLSVWTADATVLREWGSVFVQDGYAASFILMVNAKTSEVQWNSTDFLYEVGGVI